MHTAPAQAPNVKELLKAAAAHSKPLRIRPAPMPGKRQTTPCNCRSCQINRATS